MAHIAVELHSIRVKEMQNNVLNQNVYPMQMVSLLLAHPTCFRHYATNVPKNAFDLLEAPKHPLMLFTANDYRLQWLLWHSQTAPWLLKFHQWVAMKNMISGTHCLGCPNWSLRRKIALLFEGPTNDC
jgi:hypothetical protein